MTGVNALVSRQEMHRRANLSEMAGTSLNKSGHDMALMDSIETSVTDR
jgi:hypothetical protein